jgi:NAD(P)-dependent dehydrogenase (short-subunit alcohol dehydrogenase family)
MANQRVLITAGASGIGREIARAFVANGAAVFVCDLDARAHEAIAVEMPGLKTGVCDVANRQDIERMIDECAKALGGLDVLVNNAGIAGPTAPVEAMDPDEWEKVLRVDLTGTFNVTRLAIPFLKQSQAGVHQHVVGRRTIRLPEPESVRDRQVGHHRFHEDALD